MLAEATTFFSNLWLHYNGTIVLCALWGVIGVAFATPVLALDAAWRFRKTGRVYRLNGGMHFLRQKHKKDALMYTISLVSIIYVVAIIFY